jgi:hypothetical protein
LCYLIVELFVVIFADHVFQPAIDVFLLLLVVVVEVVVDAAGFPIVDIVGKT